jgi:dihydrofolate reductase
MISLIVAISQNGVIGVNNSLPWHLPEDLKNFKKITSGKSVVMGRKTFESIGKPLPNRDNIIVSASSFSNEDSSCVIKYHQDYSVAKNLGIALDFALAKSDEVFIIGGATLYKQALEEGYINKIYLTTINHSFQGDTFLDISLFKDYSTVSEEKFVSSEGLSYSIKILEK